MLYTSERWENIQNANMYGGFKTLKGNHIKITCKKKKFECDNYPGMMTDGLHFDDV